MSCELVNNFSNGKMKLMLELLFNIKFYHTIKIIHYFKFNTVYQMAAILFQGRHQSLLH